MDNLREINFLNPLCRNCCSMQLVAPSVLLQAQEQDELPEYVLGTMTCVRIDPKKAVPVPPVE